MAPPSLKTLEIAEAVTSCGYEDLVSAKLTRSKCILTFLSRENAVAIPEHGVDIDGNFFEIGLVSEPQVEIKIFDARIWVPDEQLLSALSAYGTRSRYVRHRFVRTRCTNNNNNRYRIACYSIEHNASVDYMKPSFAIKSMNHCIFNRELDTGYVVPNSINPAKRWSATQSTIV